MQSLRVARITAQVSRDADLRDQIGRTIHFDLVDHTKLKRFLMHHETPFSDLKVCCICLPVLVKPLSRVCLDLRCVTSGTSRQGVRYPSYVSAVLGVDAEGKQDASSMSTIEQ